MKVCATIASVKGVKRESGGCFPEHETRADLPTILFHHHFALSHHTHTHTHAHHTHHSLPLSRIPNLNNTTQHTTASPLHNTSPSIPPVYPTTTPEPLFTAHSVRLTYFRTRRLYHFRTPSWSKSPLPPSPSLSTPLSISISTCTPGSRRDLHRMEARSFPTFVSPEE